MKKFNQVALAALALAPTSAFAAESLPDDLTGVSPVIPKEGTLNIANVITSIIYWVLGFSAAVAVLFLIIGGLQYITASGNEKRAAAAKQTIMYAVIGLVVILLSFVIVGFIKANVGTVVQ